MLGISDLEGNAMESCPHPKQKRREREILLYRYGLYGYPEITQREIADRFKISRSYVSRIEKKALSKLRECYDASEIAF